MYVIIARFNNGIPYMELDSRQLHIKVARWRTKQAARAYARDMLKRSRSRIIAADVYKLERA